MQSVETGYEEQMLQGHARLNERWGSVLEQMKKIGLQPHEVVSRTENNFLHQHSTTLLDMQKLYNIAIENGDQAKIKHALSEYKETLRVADPKVDAILKKMEENMGRGNQ